MRPNYITLSRTKLYEMVWSKPVSELAKEFGISDVALAKRCKAIGIPLPPRGYWARVAAGQTPPRLPLPPLRETSSRLAAHKTAIAPSADEAARHRYVVTEEVDGHTEPGISFAPVTVKKAADAAATTPITLPDVAPRQAIYDMLPAVMRTARYYKHPDRGNLAFSRGESRGPIVELHVSRSILERSLRFADLFLRGAATLSWSLVDTEQERDEEPPARHYGYGMPPPAPKAPPPYGDLLVDGEHVIFRIEEATREERREATPQEEARMKREYGFRPTLVTHHPTGRLRLVRLTNRGAYAHRKSWYDRSSTPLESQIRDILAGFREQAQSIKAARERRERQEREWAEQERRRREQANVREENAKLIQLLEGQAGAWHRAQYLRRYVRAARRVLGGKPVLVPLNGHPTDLLAWADEYIAQLDPLIPVSANPDLRAERSYYYGADQERLKGELSRLSGHMWDQTQKLVPASQETKDEVY